MKKKKEVVKGKCIICGKKMKPDLEAKNFVSGEWDGHSYFPCSKCFKGNKNNLRISIG